MKLKKLSIGSDHGGFGLKEKLVKSLSEAGFSVADKLFLPRAWIIRTTPRRFAAML